MQKCHDGSVMERFTVSKGVEDGCWVAGLQGSSFVEPGVYLPLVHVLVDRIFLPLLILFCLSPSMAGGRASTSTSTSST